MIVENTLPVAAKAAALPVVQKTLTEKIMIALPLMGKGALLTVGITFAAVAIGLIGGVICGFITAERIKLRWFARAIAAAEFFISGMPIFVQLLLVFFVLPQVIGIHPSPIIAGIITISLTAIVRFAEIIRHDINLIPEGQWEACKVLGYSLRMTLWSIILPQVLRTSVASFMSESVSLLKETYIVSILGALELTKVAMNLGSKELDPVTAYVLVAFVYLAIIGVLTFIVSRIENKFLREV
jgi:His/Glu/Gln/Arg/opine family amino acid ABC transporter permease subunit